LSAKNKIKLKTKKLSFEDNLLLTKPAIGVDSLLIFLMMPGLSLLIKLKVSKEITYAITKISVSSVLFETVSKIV
jgi:hypothetical protein